jgi:hypothetical protein
MYQQITDQTKSKDEEVTNEQRILYIRLWGIIITRDRPGRLGPTIRERNGVRRNVGSGITQTGVS